MNFLLIRKNNAEAVFSDKNPYGAKWHATRRSGIMQNTNGWLIKDDKSRLKQQVQPSFLHDDLTYIMMYYGMSAETAESENAEQFVGLFLWPLRKEKCKTGPVFIPKTSAFCRYRNECQTSWVRNELEHNVRQPSARTNVLSIRSFGFIGMYWKWTMKIYETYVQLT